MDETILLLMLLCLAAMGFGGLGMWMTSLQYQQKRMREREEELSFRIRTLWKMSRQIPLNEHEAQAAREIELEARESWRLMTAGNGRAK